MSFQLTLGLIKPDVCGNPLRLQFVRKLLLQNDFLIVRSKKLRLSLAQAEDFYQIHKGKFFYNRLVTYMSSSLVNGKYRIIGHSQVNWDSGATYAHVLARYDAISTWRRLMGPTKVFRAIYEAPHTIRGSIGLSDTRNSTHGSDSPSAVEDEIDFFFPEFDVDKWHRRHETKFRSKRVIFDSVNFIHRPKTAKFM